MADERTGDEDRPDPMQSFYLNHEPLPERPQLPSSDDDDEPLRPLPPLKIHWPALVYIVAFVVLLGLVSRTVGPFAASVLAVATLGALAGWVIVRRTAMLESPDGVWLGDDGMPDGDYGGFDGGGGGDGGDG